MSPLPPSSEGSTTPLLRLLRAIDGWLFRGLMALSGGLLITIVGIITWQVLARNLPFLSSPRWTEEISLMLLVWLAMLASGLTIRLRDTLSVDIFVKRLSPVVQHVIFRLVWAAVVGFGLFLVYYGWQLAINSFGQTFATVRLPLGWMYLALPVGGALIAFYGLQVLLGRFVAESAVRGSFRWRWVLGSVGLLLLILIVANGGIASLFNPTTLLLLSFALLLALGAPIGIAIGLACVVTVARIGLPELIVAQRMASGVTATPLLAIPFFILAGQLMVQGGLAQRLVDLARVIVGPFKGGLAMVNVLDSMLFGGISGSAVADVSATGSIVIPMMKKKGYDGDYATAVTVASSVQGIIIPPSHNMVIFSLAAGGVSIGTLFLAGYLPGILMGIALMITAYVVAIRRGYPTESLPPWRESLRIVLGALPSFLVAVIIVGGIVSGIFTATESAAFGVLAALLVSGLFYRELTGPRFWEAVTQAVRTVSTVIFIIATASAFAWLMAYLRIPAQLSEFILGLSNNPIVLLLLINLMLLLLGMVMDMGPLILIMTPVLFPIVTADPINMNPVHFGIMLMVNLALGLTTPPVGTALFVGCAVGKVKIEEVSRAMLYFWPPMFLVLMIVTFFPSLVLWIPRLLGVPGT